MGRLTDTDLAELDSRIDQAVDMATDKFDRRSTDRKEKWSMEHKIPIGLLLAMVAQLMVAIWTVASYKAEMQGQLDLIKADNKVIHSIMDANADALKDTVQAMQRQFDKLNDKLDRILEARK